tara:strand:+ start:608 stop:964 length:357 start_codon:yes stop_codon:yes gene_type:complete
MDIFNEVPKIGIIDVDKIWRQKSKDSCCLDYVLFAKIERKYLKEIERDIDDLSILFINKKHFYEYKAYNKDRIHYIVEAINKFETKDLRKLLEKDYSIFEFLQKAYAIRKRNLNQPTT